MKSMTKLNLSLIALVAFLLCTSFLTKQQTNTNKYLTLRVSEGPAPAFDPKIIIVYEDSKVEEIVIDKYRTSNWVANLKKINETLNTLAGKGYEVVAMSGTDLLSTTYTLVKH